MRTFSCSAGSRGRLAGCRSGRLACHAGLVSPRGRPQSPHCLEQHRAAAAVQQCSAKPWCSASDMLFAVAPSLHSINHNVRICLRRKDGKQEKYVHKLGVCLMFYPAKNGHTERGHIRKNLGLLNCGCVNMSCDVAPSLYSINQPTFTFWLAESCHRAAQQESHEAEPSKHHATYVFIEIHWVFGTQWLGWWDNHMDTHVVSIHCFCHTWRCVFLNMWSELLAG